MHDLPHAVLLAIAAAEHDAGRDGRTGNVVLQGRSSLVFRRPRSRGDAGVDQAIGAWRGLRTSLLGCSQSAAGC